jgi:amino acid transporter
MFRRLVTDLVDLGAFGALTIGAAQAWTPAGWIVGGFCALFVSSSYARRVVVGSADES